MLRTLPRYSLASATRAPPPPTHHMMPGTGIIYAQRPAHKLNIAWKSRQTSNKDLTPYLPYLLAEGAVISGFFLAAVIAAAYDRRASQMVLMKIMSYSAFNLGQAHVACKDVPGRLTVDKCQRTMLKASSKGLEGINNATHTVNKQTLPVPPAAETVIIECQRTKPLPKRTMLTHTGKIRPCLCHPRFEAHRKSLEKSQSIPLSPFYCQPLVFKIDCDVCLYSVLLFN